MNAHFIFENLAFITGFFYYQHNRKGVVEVIPENQRLCIIIAAAFGALVGSRVLAVFEIPDDFWLAHNKWLYFMSNKTIVGGLLGGTLFVEMSKKFLGITLSTGDLFVFPLMLAMIIGRIGCLTNGLDDGTVGIATSLPWGINFGDGIARHPTSLYEIIFLLFLWVALSWLRKNYELNNGILFRLFMLGYLFYRFLVGFIQPTYATFFGLTAIQIASMITIFIYSRTLINPHHYRYKNANT